MKCPNCGEENFPGSSFCSNCGTPLTGDEASYAPTDALNMAETIVGAAVPHFLVYMTADKQIQTRAIEDKLRIGRESDNEIVLQDPRISRHHAVITRRGDGFEIEDLESANGVQVNGVRIAKPHMLVEGDKLKLGDSELVFSQSRTRPSCWRYLSRPSRCAKKHRCVPSPSQRRRIGSLLRRSAAEPCSGKRCPAERFERQDFTETTARRHTGAEEE